MEPLRGLSPLCLTLMSIIVEDIHINAHPHNEGSNSSNPVSPTIDMFEDDLRHPLGSNGSTNENERAATSKDNIATSEGDVVDVIDTKPIPNMVNQPLRRSKRS
nr:hypothetical protein [Tanacetum cinerariifolium]